jgi:GR25 family glycosyltransferase involved in LPS biosynthesis
MIKHSKVNLRNFGCKEIFVISDKNNIKRRKDFIEAWSSFEGFDFTFVDAIMGQTLDIPKLISDGQVSTTFNCRVGSLSRNILGVGLSHKKTWELIIEKYGNEKSYNRYKDWYLILEDDARPTKELCDLIFDGEYKNFLNEINKYHIDFLYLGRAKKPFIRGERFNNYFVKPTIDNDYAAHAYMVKPHMVEMMKNMYNLQMAVDIFIDTNFKKDIYSTHQSLIQQQGHLLGKFIMPPHDKNYEYSSSTQINFFTTKTEKGLYLIT